MQRRMTIEALARRVAEAEEEAQTQHDPLRVARERLASTPAAASNRGTEWLRNGAWAMVGAMAAVVVLAVIRPGASGFEVVHSGGVSNVPLGGEPILATESAGAALQFSDGSTIRLERGAQVRVGHLDSRGAQVSLDQGQARVHVVHKSDTRWVVSAGPFQVRITGTTFNLSWEPDRRRVRINMMEGAVSVSGCALAEVVVPAGQSLEATCDGGAPQVVPQPGPPAAPEGSTLRLVESERPTEPVPREMPALGQVAETDAGSPGEAGDARLSGPGWRELAVAGRLKEAFEAAEAPGFDGECAGATGEELLNLSDAALVAGRSDRARQALLAVRTRFPASSLAATAAFRLGRLAFDRGGAAGEARRWFRTYLEEQPGGGFAREARGRLIEVEQRSGNTTEAQRLARDYLRTWPQGPHAPLARSLVAD